MMQQLYSERHSYSPTAYSNWQYRFSCIYDEMIEIHRMQNSVDAVDVRVLVI